MEIIIGFIGVLLGIFIGLFVGRASGNKEAEISRLQTLLDEKEKELESKSSKFEFRLQEKEREFEKAANEKNTAFHESLNRQKESFEREIENIKESNKALMDNMEKSHKDALRALKDQFAESSNSLTEQLKNTTQQMLKQRQEEFSEVSSEKIGQILQPLKNSLQAMQEKVTENTTRHTELGGKLSESLQILLSHTDSARESADRLASMLKGNSKHQGEWGERILKEILESLNLRQGIHFDLQQTLTDGKGDSQKNDEGKKGRPDVILHLDRNKDVIIDSKVSLTAYLEYMEAQSDETRQEALKKHIASLEKHVKELEKKDYSGYVSPSRVKLGYVIMFVPNTSALLLATNAKPTLWREAMEKNVYIADEQTLYAALKIVSLTWRQILQNANQQEVFQLAEEMIQRVGSFMKSYNDIGQQLVNAKESYDAGMKKLVEGGQSIPQTCRKLVKLGAKVSKLPKGVDPSLFNASQEAEDYELEPQK